MQNSPHTSHVKTLKPILFFRWYLILDLINNNSQIRILHNTSSKYEQMNERLRKIENIFKIKFVTWITISHIRDKFLNDVNSKMNARDNLDYFKNLQTTGNEKRYYNGSYDQQRFLSKKSIHQTFCKTITKWWFKCI